MGMTADDDVLDAESRHGEFNGRCLPTVGRTVRRHDVPSVAKNEQVTRLRASQQVRVDAGVRTSDEQRFGVLPLRQVLKQPLERAEVLLLELVDALN